MDRIKDDAINTSDTQIYKAENIVENCEQPKQKRQRVEKCKVVNSADTLSNFQPTLICSQCITESVGNAFIANTRHAMDLHLNEVYADLVCCFCFTEEKIMNNFLTEKLLKEHQLKLS